MWARFLVELLPRMSGTEFRRAVDVVGPLRMVKDAAEIEALRTAGAAADRVARQLHAGDIPLVGRTEAQVSADISARLVAEGHDKVNFAIVAAGENAASPHHHAGDRVIRADEIVLCDFGGTMAGYCSDTTRCVFTGSPPTEIADAYAVLHEAQQASVAAAVVGTPCQEVDRVARRIIADAGFGDYFVHRTGHGIGMEEHEDPYIVEGNDRPLVAGHAFSVEPGIYVPGRWGMRLEDIVVATDAGPEPLNASDHASSRSDGLRSGRRTSQPTSGRGRPDSETIAPSTDRADLDQGRSNSDSSAAGRRWSGRWRRRRRRGGRAVRCRGRSRSTSRR